MAPRVPEEVDVYHVPHLLMKELVTDCKLKCDTTNFTHDDDLEKLLTVLIRTFVEFKNHEMIENTLIMKKLKSKLKKLSIRNTAVCNCHKDSHLIDMLKILKEGYSKKTKQDRINYGIQLRNAIEEFAEDFLPHMKEEEETFGPLLQKYFTYDELKDLRSRVIDKHLEQKQNQVEHQVQGILEAEQLEKWALEQQIKESSCTEGSSYEGDVDGRSAVEELMRLEIRGSKVKQNRKPLKTNKAHKPQTARSGLEANIEEKQEVKTADDSSKRKLHCAQEVKLEVLPEVLPKGKQEVLPEVKHEVLPEVKHEVLPEVKQEVKQEVLPEVLPDSKPLPAPETSITELPPEVLLKVMWHLNPRDLCRSAQVCKQWSSVAMDVSLWKHLHPVEWANGDWDYTRCYGSDHVEDDVDDYSGSYHGDSEDQYVVIDDDADTDESEMPTDGDTEQDEIIKQIQKEGRILLGLKNHVVHKIGASVRSLNLAQSQALTSGVLQKLLAHCPNLETLDLSQTRVSDAALKGLGEKGSCRSLKHLILTGCHNVSDVTLLRVAMAVNTPLIGQRSLIDSSEAGVACVCTRQKIEKCDHSDLCEENEEKHPKLKNETYSGHVDDVDKDIDETQEMESQENSKNEKDQERYDDPFENERSCDKASGEGGNHGSWLDKTGYGFYGDPRDFCRTICAAAQPGARNALNIEDCAHLGPPSGRSGNYDLSVIPEVPYNETGNRSPFVKDHVIDCGHDIDKQGENREGAIYEEGAWIEEKGADWEKNEKGACLEYLSLSGCYKITDKGLSALYSSGPLPRLTHIDLSGCMNVTSGALTGLVDACPALDPTRLSYCDNIIDGPCADTANGCNNIGCSRRFCCRT